MAYLFIPTLLRKYIQQESLSLHVPGNTVYEVLMNFSAQYPSLKNILWDTHGALNAYLNIYLNAKNIRTSLDLPVKDQDEITFITAMSGG